jgi:ribulose-phosphate 3-epimerase
MSERSRAVKISPSLMCADLLNLETAVTELVELGVDYLHIDVMDGHYVPNLTLGTDLTRALADEYDLPLDIHLMVDDPDRWIPVFAEAAVRDGKPAPILSIHPETTWHPARSLAAAAGHGARPAIAVDPGQKPEVFEYLLEVSSLVLVMTVNPGYAGQKLVPWTLRSVEWLAAARERLGLSYEIEVDGNVSWENIPRMIDAGADVLVAGSSSLFDAALSRKDACERMRAMAATRAG